MLIPLRCYVDELEFSRLLLKHFPELSAAISNDAGLLHSQMAHLERLANQSIRGGDWKRLGTIYEFIGDLARHRSEVDPDVINAIHVSFLEGLNFNDKRNGARAQSLLPPILRTMWQRQTDHNNAIWHNHRKS